MASKVRVNISRGKVVSVVGPMANQAAYRAAQRTRGYVIAEIWAAGRVKTGAMIRGMQVRRVGGSPLSPRYEVSGSAPHTGFQNDGTRAHGPRRAKVLAWQGPNGMVYARWVRGVTGAHFMEKGLAKVRVADFLP